MTEDPQAINDLVDRLIDEFEAERGDDHHPKHLHRYQRYFSKADQLVTIYETQVAQSPNDKQLKAYLGRLLYLIASMYFDFIIPGPLSRQERTPEENIECARKTCDYAFRSYTASPNEAPAMLLANVFLFVGFHATACHWLREAERIATSFNDVEAAIPARAKRMELEGAGQTIDPPITSRTVFPSNQTPGLHGNIAGKPDISFTLPTKSLTDLDIVLESDTDLEIKLSDPDSDDRLVIDISS